MQASLKGKVAVVTGAAEGIGAAITRGLIAMEADLALVDMKPIDIAALKAQAGPGQRIHSYVCDAALPAEIKAATAALQKDFGDVSVLVNNVGGAGNIQQDDIEEITDENWDYVISLSLSSSMRFSRELVGGMKRQKFGRIVNISSSLKDGIFGGAGTVRARLPYITAKMALVGLTKQLANDLGPFGITANAVAPGLTLPGPDAKITKRYMALPPEEQKKLSGHTPNGRLASGEDIANAVCFLASPLSGHINGETIKVAGGA